MWNYWQSFFFFTVHVSEKELSPTRAFTHHAALKLHVLPHVLKEGGSHLTSFAVYRGAAQVPLQMTGEKLAVFIMSDVSTIMQETHYENAASDCAVIPSIYPPPINRFYFTFSCTHTQTYTNAW